MEQLIEDLEALSESGKKLLPDLGNYIYQPEKVQISSNDDLNNSTSQDSEVEDFYSGFQVQLPRPINSAKQCQINRISIPTPTTNIPDHDLVFWYYRLPKNGALNRPVNVSLTYLKCIRLLPSTYHKEIMPTAYENMGYNRTFTDYQDLATELQKSCLNDTATNQYFLSYTSGGINITYDQTSNKFSMVGGTTDGSFYYLAAGYLDPNVAIAAADLQADTEYETGLLPISGQPYRRYRTLNLRLGFTWDGANTTFTTSYAGCNTSLVNRVRPLPSYWLSDGLLEYTPNRTTLIYTASSYACLVYTNVINVYCDFTGPSTLDTTFNTGLLASIPMATNNLGVGFYQASMDNILSKIPSNLYSLTFYFKDDIGDPYFLPNSAVISLELNFKY